MTYDILSILPPVVAIVLAIYSRQTIVSLLFGVWIGACILMHGNIIAGFIYMFRDLLIPTVGSSNWNWSIWLLMLIIGGFIALLERSGGTLAFVNATTRYITNRTRAQIGTSICGLLLFFSDSANCLILGPLFKPIYDKMNISREKLAFIIDSTSSSVCALVMITSWGAYMTGLIGGEYAILGISESPFAALAKSVPFQFYTILTIFIVFLIPITGRDYGPMKKAEDRAKTGKVLRDGAKPIREEVIMTLPEGFKPKITTMLIPIITLLVVLLSMFLWTGGFPEVGVMDAISNAESALSIMIGWAAASIVIMILIMTQKIMSLDSMLNTFIKGSGGMIRVLFILLLAWALGGVCRELGTAQYIVDTTEGFLSPKVLPALIFLIGCSISFATGTSWGTFAILTPLAIPLSVAVGSPVYACIGAIFSGGLFGDHCSPISDTTIMSSMGATCDHIDHVRTQLPYACTSAVAAFIAYLVAGITGSWLSLFLGMGILILLVYTLPVLLYRQPIITK